VTSRSKHAEKVTALCLQPTVSRSRATAPWPSSWAEIEAATARPGPEVGDNAGFLAMEALHEIQAANFLGYRRIADFRRDLKRGDIPAPDRKLASGPVWSRTRLQAWLDNDAQFEAKKRGETEALERLGRYGAYSD